MCGSHMLFPLDLEGLFSVRLPLPGEKSWGKQGTSENSISVFRFSQLSKPSHSPWVSSTARSSGQATPGEATQVWRHACGLSAHCLTSDVIGSGGREATWTERAAAFEGLLACSLVLDSVTVWDLSISFLEWQLGTGSLQECWDRDFLGNRPNYQVAINYFPVQMVTDNCFKKAHPIYVYLQGDYRYQTFEREHLRAFVHEALVVQFSLEA